jgi:diguanylate cyclase (GGDEF)-like protein
MSPLTPVRTIQQRILQVLMVAQLLISSFIFTAIYFVLPGEGSDIVIAVLLAGVLFNLLLLVLVFTIFRRDLLQRQALMESLQLQSREIGSLNELNSSLLLCASQEEALQVIGPYLAQLFPDTAGILYLYRASRNVLECQLQWGDMPEPQPERLPNEDCWALRRGQVHPQLVASDLPCTHYQLQGQYQRICVPMMAVGETLGMLHVIDTRAKDGVFINGMRLKLLETTVSQVASAIANLNLRAALHAQSIRDPLTALFNRRYLEETMEREEMRAQRNHQPLSIIMADIDHFKNFNDAHGHHAGDLLLQAIAQVLQAMVRGDDIACRYGGEEFLLILPGVSLEKALERAEEVREAVSRIKVELQGALLPQLTCSFGVACYPQHGTHWPEVLEQADVAMYSAKHQGRNRSVAAKSLSLLSAAD